MNTNDKKTKMEGGQTAASHLGIDNLVSLAIDAVDIGEEIAEALKDGIQLQDGFVILTNLNKLENIAQKAKPALQEIGDLSAAELEEFEQRVAAGANLPNTGVAGKVRRVIRYAAKVYRHIEATIDLVGEGKDVFTGLREAA